MRRTGEGKLNLELLTRFFLKKWTVATRKVDILQPWEVFKAQRMLQFYLCRVSLNITESNPQLASFCNWKTIVLFVNLK